MRDEVSDEGRSVRNAPARHAPRDSRSCSFLSIDRHRQSGILIETTAQSSQPVVAMPQRLHDFLETYLTRRWAPSAVTGAVIVLTTFVAGMLRNPPGIIAKGAFSLLIVALVGMLFCAAIHLVKRRWGNGLINFAMIPVCLVAGIGAPVFTALIVHSGDGFADHLRLPTGIEMSIPSETSHGNSIAGEDRLQLRIRQALSGAGSDDPSVTVEVPSLVQLNQRNPDILKRYLATSPAWRLIGAKGSLGAIRRWKKGSHWRDQLNGYYSDFSPGQQKFVAKVVLHGSLNGQFSTGQTIPLSLRTANNLQESREVFKLDGIAVEVIEQSSAKERRVTKTVLRELEDEFRPLAVSPDWLTIQQLLPPGSIKDGTPTFELLKGVQPGIYESEIWLNPGEPGMIYLKAFEVTKGTALTVTDLKEDTKQWVGWSDLPQQMFFATNQFTIYEGDWGQFYAARFEVWFVPYAKGPERKLLEKVYKIEGWQR